MNQVKTELRFDLVPLAEGLEHEVSLLKEWFDRDYPESELRVHCDFNGVLFSLSIVVEVLMGDEVSSNRLFFKSQPIRLTEKDLKNPGFMSAFMKYFNEGFRKQISGAFNRHYAVQKERDEETSIL